MWIVAANYIMSEFIQSHVCSCCFLLLVFGSLQVLSGPILPAAVSPEQIEQLLQHMQRKRIVKLDMDPNTQARQADSGNDAALETIKYLSNLPSVNFNQQKPNVVRGDVYVFPPPEEATPANTSANDTETHSRTKRKAINTLYNIVKKWENAELFYQVQQNAFTDVEGVRRKIREALKPIEDNSCIKFTEILPTIIYPSDKSLVKVKDNDGTCASFIGRIPNTNQDMSLSPACQITGTIQHEFFHALGFGHEHERPDRDEYIKVNPKYILSTYIHNFDKEPKPTYFTNIPYDLTSVTHYALNQFSIDLSANTLEVIDPYFAINALDIGQRIRFSWLDEVGLNKYYECQGDCSDNCQNGGYMRKDNGVCRCICPPGLAGSLCTEVSTTCGQYVDLSTSGGLRVIQSAGHDGTTELNKNELCYFFIKGQGYLELTFSHFHVQCDNFLEIRKFGISQPSLGLCGSTLPSVIDTRFSPTPEVVLLVYDTTKSSASEKGWSLTARSFSDACLGDPCHGAKCIPVQGSTNQYSCVYPDYPLHCGFDEGLLRACSRIRFNKYYQVANEFELAFQVDSNNGRPSMSVSSDITSLPQRGVATIVPHAFAGKTWCLSFSYRMLGDDQGTISVYLAKNGILNGALRLFTDTASTKTFRTVVRRDIDGSSLASSDMAEVVFEARYTNNNRGLDTILIDDIHLVPTACPAPSDPCSSDTVDCNDAECVSVSGTATCVYPDTDIHCTFEPNENGCLDSLEYNGVLWSQDDADWTIHSGPTVTDGTGPSSAIQGQYYLYVESNFPPKAVTIRTAYLLLAPRKSANRCLSFSYHMFGSEVIRLQVGVAIYDSLSVPTHNILWETNGNQGDEWKSALIDININNRQPNVKIQVEIIAKGRNTYSDIAIDDLHLTKGVCDRTPVNGVWATWGSWTSCSATCGAGSQQRSRTCTPPKNGGLSCPGSSTETQVCNSGGCPTDGEVTEWSEWQQCSATCGTLGQQQRTRSCKPPINNGASCPSFNAVETKECNRVSCPAVWNSWGSWSECSITCGGSGQESRTRTCGPTGTDNTCQGLSTETRSCQRSACVVDAVVSEWQDWMTCSVSCGSGERTRTRTCVQDGHNGGVMCSMKRLEENESCQMTPCPVDAQVSNWGIWSDCTATCGEGTKTRSRTCTAEGSNGGSSCSSIKLTESEACNNGACPLNAQLGSWTGWSGCSKTCGGGTNKRTRQCTTQGSNGGKMCSDFILEESVSCNDDACPVDGVLSSWSSWSTCSATCGDGTTSRSRTCSPAQNGGKECGDSQQVETISCTHSTACESQQLSAWSTWSGCSVPCGTGTNRRTRSCLVTDCGQALLEESLSCEITPCPIDGVLLEWSEWETCSVSCGGGTQQRTRLCRPQQHGGTPCSGSLTEDQSCNTQLCPINGVWKDWGSWGACSVTCGVGVRKRTRECMPPQHGGLACQGLSESEIPCNDGVCSVDGKWTSWSEWLTTECCSGKKLFRTRSCEGRLGTGNDCTGSSREEGGSCPSSAFNNCPTDAIFLSWGQWSSCSGTCGVSTQTRIRDCTTPINGGKNCEGPRTESRPCSHPFGCASSWTSWGGCSVSCGLGIRTRFRDCSTMNCGTVPLQDSEPCQAVIPACFVEYNPWQTWSSCSHSCGPQGIRTRVRNCHGRPLCDFQDQREEETCNTIIQCPVDGHFTEWTEWGDCAVSCGTGFQFRTRECVRPIGNGKPCIGDFRDWKSCDAPCETASWSDWGSWGQCSVSCDSGQRSRTRTCQHATESQKCVGESSMSESCIQPNCVTVTVTAPGEWGEWTQCSLSSCNRPNPSSFQTRVRNCPTSQACFGMLRFEFQRCVPDCNGGHGSTSSPAQLTTTTPSAIDGAWTVWSDWSSCTPHCTGVKIRRRTCTQPSNGGRPCVGSATELSTCSQDPDCQGLESGNDAKVCEGFEESDSVATYGTAIGISPDTFQIASGPSNLYFSRARSEGGGQTGPEWAAEGKNYLLFSSRVNTRSEFHFKPFNMKAGACLEFKYLAYGDKWNGGSRVELVIIGNSNTYSQALWSNSPTDSPFWKSVQVNIQPQRDIFELPRPALVLIAGGQFSDLAIDDLQIVSKPCARNQDPICPPKELVQTQQCGFESGDDCSWITKEETTGSSSSNWHVWKGSTPTRGTGPTSANSGSNYLYVEADNSRVGLQRLRRKFNLETSRLSLGWLKPGPGCLEFSLHMFGRNKDMGTLTIKLPDNKILFSESKNRGNRWRQQRVGIASLPSGVGNSKTQLFLEYRSGRGSRSDIAIDDIKYTSGRTC